MGDARPLHGSCSCGRYNYVVMIPTDGADAAQLHFVTDSQHRRSTASLLNTYLRIPLAWYTSHTVSFLPDETHHTISRTFTPAHQPHSQRKFCGYCGTHLSYWTEEPREEEGYLHINVGSLQGRDLHTLEDLGLLETDSDEEGENDNDNGDQDVAEAQGAQTKRARTDVEQSVIRESAPLVRLTRRGQIGDLAWFEEMMDGSRLGRSNKTRRGFGTTADGTTSISWEVSEHFDELDDPTTLTAETLFASGSKRKIGDVTDDDIKMS